MRVVVTGGAGFVGGATVRRLLADGIEVIALDRDVSRTNSLADAGAVVVRDDLRDVARLAEQFRGADAVVHAAGSYRVGITVAERPAMEESNVGAAALVLDAAAASGIRHVIHVSTYGVFGDTGGRIVDETYRRDPAGGYLSWYDETKHRAHLDAEGRRAAGLPLSIVLLGAAYGLGDTSGLGDQLRRAALGRLPAIGSPTLGVSWTHVDDLADGIARVLGHGQPGADWNLGGEIGTLRDGIVAACLASGRRPPRVVAPRNALLALGRLGPRVCAGLGFPANLAEAVRSTDGITFWGTHAKAAQELGYAPRPMAEGFEATFGPLRASR
jgi:dihydroflavonol-4-reductase